MPLVNELKNKGVDILPVTLHIGLGTFRPVEVEDLTKHRMDSEFYHVTPAVAERSNIALKSATNTVTAVGTTVVRAIESSLSAAYTLKANIGWTDKFIYPQYDFHITERLITNFHMPRSTLMMLVAAFAGYDFMIEAYKTAKKDKYRLFSFGDAMLIL
jgi:S-adenosylmethionine:tRNA ribosyltransferase-isomerase